MSDGGCYCYVCSMHKGMIVAGCFTDQGFNADQWSVACPFCGDDYSHIREVGTLLGGDAHEAGIYRGTQVVGVAEYRRSALSIVFDGECGHSWELRIQQHKGVNLVQVRQLVPPEIP